MANHKVMAADTPEGKAVVIIVDHTEAAERIDRAMYRIRSDTSLIGIGTMSDRIMGYQPVMIPTCATDGKYIYYNPLFVETMSEPELRFVMLHEVMHVAYSHHLRLEDRNMQVANIAMDYMVNGILCSSDAARRGFIKLLEGGLHDDFFVGKKWSFETIYDYLLANADKYPMVQQALDQEDEDGTCGQCGKQRASSDPGDGDGEKSQAEDGSGGDGTDSTDADGDGDGEKCECEGGGKATPRPGEMGGFGTWGEVWPAPAEVMAEAKKEHDEIQQKLSEGEFMEKSFSPEGGSDAICGTMRHSDEDTVGWHHLKEYLTSVYSYENTWARPNLLRLSTAYYPSRDQSAGTLHIALDTSGSVSDRELQIFLANTREICDQVGVHTLKIAYIDSEIRRPTGETWHEIEVASGEEVEFIISGRGGTNFDPIFNCIEEEQEEVECLIYFTDGWGGAYNLPPDYPVVWATTDQPVQWWGQWGEWGETIQIAPARW